MLALEQAIREAGLTPTFCAGLLGVNPKRFDDWIKGSRPLPSFVAPKLSTILGVPESDLRGTTSSGPRLPNIWYKLAREERLTVADREFVGLVRQLGYSARQLQKILGKERDRFAALFRDVQEQADPLATPDLQGRAAAKAFREISGLAQGQLGIGEVLRPYLRSIGLLLVESPLNKSAVQGCSFRVESDGGAIPCLFANTYSSTWFRRNVVLAHELGHVISDASGQQVSVDYTDDTLSSPSEQRAQAFAQELLVPASVLSHLANQHGLRWDALSASNIALLIAKTHVEQKTVLAAARDAGFIREGLHDRYIEVDTIDILRDISPHARDSQQYLQSLAGADAPLWRVDNRRTTVGSRRLILPSGYLDQIIQAVRDHKISLGKAAELALMDEEVFVERFGILVGEQG